VKSNNLICSTESLIRQEPTEGTLGEYDGAWFIEGHKPFPRLALASVAPAMARTNLGWWDEYQRTGRGPHPRILPIRQSTKPARSGHQNLLLVPVSDQNTCRQFEFSSSSIEELEPEFLLELTANPASFAHLETETVRAIVCTHGKVDPCCAKSGNALYRTLLKQQAIEVWQGAHFGGCRFAGNIWFLPSGNCYGHVAPENVHELVKAEQQQQVFHTGFRGRLGQSTIGSVAEYRARQHYELWEFEALHVQLDRMERDLWLVKVSLGDQQYSHHLSRSFSLERHYLTCESEEPSNTYTYEFQ
jgi:hypothetical protein